MGRDSYKKKIDKKNIPSDTYIMSDSIYGPSYTKSTYTTRGGVKKGEPWNKYYYRNPAPTSAEFDRINQIPLLSDKYKILFKLATDDNDLHVELTLSGQLNPSRRLFWFKLKLAHDKEMPYEGDIISLTHLTIGIEYAKTRMEYYDKGTRRRTGYMILHIIEEYTPLSTTISSHIIKQRTLKERKKKDIFASTADPAFWTDYHDKDIIGHKRFEIDNISKRQLIKSSQIYRDAVYARNGHRKRHKVSTLKWGSIYTQKKKKK